MGIGTQPSDGAEAAATDAASGAPTTAAAGADLRPPSPDRWDRVRVPPGWEAVAAITRRVAHDLDALVERITDAIVAEIPGYRRGDVPRGDLRGSVHRNIEALLLGLAEGRPPHPQEVAARRELGTRRALQGLPVDALIRAYHVGYREVWLALVAALPPDDADASHQLLTTATLVWQWTHEVADALADAHSATVRSLEARALGTRQRFVELLLGGDLDGAEPARLARSLDLDPAGPFQVAVVRGGPEHDTVALQRALDDLGGRCAVVERGTRLVVVAQRTPTEALADACRRGQPGAAIGIGAERSGLHGARASLTDAELTLEITEDGATSTFEDAWLWATLTGSAERLEPLLGPGAAVAGDHPHLAEAVRAFADAGFSVSQAARQLKLHANTVAYRLDRWGDLTGWDPRSYAGLTRSIAALRLRR